MIARVIGKPVKAWALVSATGLFILSSIGPTYGAVLGWVERERRRGLSEMAQRGETIQPVDITFDHTRDDQRQVDRNRREMAKTGR